MTMAIAQAAIAAMPDIPERNGTAASIPREEAAIRQDIPAPVAIADAHDDGPVVRTEPAPDPRNVECVAKVIVHEAANQPRIGRVAVAQVIRTRLRSGRFPATACGVVKQRGQFFDVDAYDPPRSGARWTSAVDIAVETLSGRGDDVVPGALFFQSARAAMPARVRVAQIADHIFYR